MTQILLLEDDPSLIDGLEYSLKKNGFAVETVRAVEEALGRVVDPSGHYDLLLLDVTLPDGTGFEVCEKVREQNPFVPIIFLTASDEEVNVIRGLDSGGDDYITKPFKIGELCSRIRALLRRAVLNGQAPADPLSHAAPHAGSHAGSAKTASESGSVISSGGLTIDLLGSRATLNGRKLELTAAEYRLLCLLARSADRIVTRDRILAELWDSAGDFVDDNTLSVYIRRLREKIEDDPSRPRYLTTVRGFGYQWNPGGGG